MTALLRHLLDPAYLYAQRTGAEGAWGVAAPALLAAVVVAAALAWRRAWMLSSRGAPLRTWAASCSALLAAAALYAVARVSSGLLSARIWYLSASAVALGLAIVAAIRRPLARIPWLTQVLDAVTGRLRPEAPYLPWGPAVALGAVHCGGVAALTMAAEVSWWLPALALACLAATGWRRIEILTPLLVSYGGWVLRALVGGVLGINTWAYLAFPYPDPWSPWFDRRATLLMGVGGTLLLTVEYAIRRLGVHPGAHRRGPLRSEARYVIALVAAGGAVLWFAAMIIAHRSHGATGSDPFCYLQMATDLARHGSAIHRFPLAPLLWENGLPAWPAVPVGYHPPDPSGHAATVWPIGWPVILAGLIRLGGEALALWGAPLCALLAAWFTYRLAGELDPGLRRRPASPIAGTLGAAILLTSREAALRALVPMADAAAQALSVAMILSLWRGRRRDSLAWSGLAGLLLAWAYWVRHPLLPLALAAIPAYCRTAWSWRRRLAHLAVYGAAALAGALPDLAYHRQAFGSVWVAESPEWSLLAWRHIVPSIGTMLRDGWLRREEFGYLMPLVLIGIAGQWRARRHRAAAATLWAGFGGALLLALSYSALRLRDLLPLFPWAALWAGWGTSTLWRWATSQDGGRLRRAAVLLGIGAVLAARVSPTVAVPWQEGVWTFGHVTAAQRAAFDALDAVLPHDAVVATGLNAGAVMRYTGRETVRPASWSDGELATFATLLIEQGRPMVLLVDGEEMETVLAHARGLLPLERVETFDIPVMGRGGQWQEGPAALYAAWPERVSEKPRAER